MGQTFIIEIECGMMQWRGITIADPEEGPGTLLQHEGEVLRSHGRLGLAIDLDFRICLEPFNHEVDPIRVVAGHGKEMAMLQPHLYAECASRPFAYFSEALQASCSGCIAQGPERTGDRDVIGDDVEGVSSLEGG